MLAWLSDKRALGRDTFATKTSLAVTSTEFCQALFDESYIRRSLSGNCGHKAMIPSLSTENVDINWMQVDQP
jgi:hypothetical protein